MDSLRKFLNLVNSIENGKPVIILLLLVIGAFLEMLSVGMIFPFFTFLFSENLNSLWIVQFFGLEDMPRQALVTAGLSILIIIYIIKSGFLIFSSWFVLKIVYRFQEKLSVELYKHYLDKSFLYHVKNNSSKIIRNVIINISALVEGGVLPAAQLISEILVVFSLIFVLLYIEPLGTVTVLLFYAVFTYITYRLMEKKLTHLGGDRNKYDALRLQSAQQGLNAIKEVKVAGVEKEFVNSYALFNKYASNSIRDISFLKSVPSKILEFFMICGVVILFLTFESSYEIKSMVSTIAVFAVASFRLMPSVNRIISSINSINSVRAALESLCKVFDDESLISEHRVEIIKKYIPKTNEWTQINVKNLTYEYSGTSITTLSNITFQIDRGEFIGIVGESGSGNTTLINIILGLIKPKKGDILVDGISIYNDLELWRSKIGYVSQEVCVIDDTVAKNIALGACQDDIDFDRIDKVLRAARLDKVVANLNGGVNSLIGENGLKISGGQRQRIGIARALYKNSDILILDEATSALDIKNESKILDSLQEIKGLVTVIMITHRINTLSGFDKVYSLDSSGIKLFRAGEQKEI